MTNDATITDRIHATIDQEIDRFFTVLISEPGDNAEADMTDLIASINDGPIVRDCLMWRLLNEASVNDRACAMGALMFAATYASAGKRAAPLTMIGMLALGDNEMEVYRLAGLAAYEDSPTYNLAMLMMTAITTGQDNVALDAVRGVAALPYPDVRFPGRGVGV